MIAQFDPARLERLARARMPFGKYEGLLLIDLPEPYVVWFHRNGYPKGSLGQLLREIYEIKVNGLEFLFDPLREIPRPSRREPTPTVRRRK